MLLIEHSTINNATIRDKLGAPHHSYWFVRKSFQRVIPRLGEPVQVSSPETEVDAIYDAARSRGEDCLFLSFGPPQSTTLGLRCPTIPVFAWEYDTIPYETWDGDQRQNWKYVLEQVGRAVTLSRDSARSVQRCMGPDFPVWAIPTPLYDIYAGNAAPAQGWRAPFEFIIEDALAINVGDVDLTWFRPERPIARAVHALQVLEHAAAQRAVAAQTLRLEGVVYTTVLNPGDHRKNWRDLLSGFVWAFRNTPNATLLVKLTHADIEVGLLAMLCHFSTLGDFKCRIVLINGLLSEQAYAGLIDATSYTVNTALAEGLCMPLVEYMSAGRPAVAPRHTAMLDYIGPENAFVIRSDERLACWPQDERMAMRAHHGLISFSDLVQQFRASYVTARDAPEKYAAMSAAAIRSMKDFCSDDVVAAQLGEVTRSVAAGEAH